MEESFLFKWVVLASSTLASAVVFGTTFTFGSIIRRILDKYQSGRSSSAAVQGLLVGVSFNAGILSGILVSRVGLLKTTILGATLCSLGLSSAYFATSIYHLYILIGCITGLGCSMIFICSTTAISMVFTGPQRVLALALQSAGLSVAGITLPYLYNALCARYGLNGAFLMLGGVNLNCFPLALIFFITERICISKYKENSREKCNLQEKSNEEIIRKRIDIFLAEISAFVQNLFDVLSLPYLILCLGSGIAYGSIIAFMSLVIDILSWKGFTDSVVLLVFPTAYASGFVARVLIGALNRCSIEKLLIIPTVFSLCGCCGIFMIYQTNTLPLILTGSALIGICQSGVSVTFILSSQLAEEKNLSIRVGLLQTCMGLLAATLGPFFGSIRDSTQSYDVVLMLTAGLQFFGACMFVAALVAWKNPVKNQKEIRIGESVKGSLRTDDL